MDELFRFSLARPPDPRDASTIPLERASDFQAAKADAHTPGLEVTASQAPDYDRKWAAFEVAALRYLLSDPTDAFIASVDLRDFTRQATEFLSRLEQSKHDEWPPETQMFVDGLTMDLAALDIGLADLFLALMILRSGGPTHLQTIVRKDNLSPETAELLIHEPTLEDLSTLIHVVYLAKEVREGNAPATGAAINRVLRATLLLPPKIFASFEKPVHPVGVTELLVVKQHVLRYELGEIARIENILKGELRDHTQTHTLSNERETFVTTEKQTETDQELSNTDHVSLRNEIATTLNEDTKVDGGLHAQYSGIVKIQTDLTVAHDKSSTEARQAATEMAKDVTQRAAQKVSERIQQSETTRIIETFNETEEQKFENHDANVSGVYQWVDKVYLTQVFNYGKHLVFDVMVPEPASSLLEADQVPLRSPPTPPTPLAISPLDLSANPGPNFYGTYVEKYKAEGVSPPPTDLVVLSSAKSFPWQDNQGISGSEVIPIDDGYEAFVANVFVDYLTNDDSVIHIQDAAGNFICYADVTLGADRAAVVHAEERFDGRTPRRGFRTQAVAFNPVIEHSLPMSIVTGDINELSVNVEVICRPTATKMAKWRLDTYQAIASAWQKLQEDYEAKIEAARLEQQQVGILGDSPPDLNRQTERTELKRSCIAILDGRKVTGYDDVEEVPIDTLSNPRIGSPTFFDDGSWVRWFEQAFEWDKMSYVFYPYFWGRHTEWGARLQRRYDSDPLFENFLRAGYARVVVPVRDGFRDAINFYLATGRPWMGGDLPSVGDKTYLPITEEIKEQTGAPGKEKPVGDPWEFRLPTQLIKLRNDDKLPPEWTWDGHDQDLPVPPGPWTWKGDTGG